MKKNAGLILSGLLVLTAITIGLYWLAIGILIMAGIYFLFTSNIKFFIWLKKNRFLSPALMLLFILIFAISVRVFLIEIFVIPSGSMENTLIKGDKILVSKLNYGPTLPRGPFDIPWINLIWYLQAKASTNFDSVYWNYRRLNGYSLIRNNDVVVFLHPLSKEKDNFVIKRCVGIAGDTLQIINGTVSINGRPLPVPDRVKQDYSIWENKWVSFKKISDSLHLEINDVFPDKTEDGIKISLTNLQHKQLSGLNGIDSFLVDTTANDSTKWVYPKNKIFSWTIDNCGPVVVPRKGMMMNLTHRNYLIYQRTINRLEKQKIKEKDGLFYLNEESVTTYTFRHNYYFMMGDYRSESEDSRFWGFVPEENIIGKAVVVLFSNDEEGFKWRRMLKLIR